MKEMKEMSAGTNAFIAVILTAIAVMMIFVGTNKKGQLTRPTSIEVQTNDIALVESSLEGEADPSIIKEGAVQIRMAGQNTPRPTNMVNAPAPAVAVKQ